MPVLACCPAGCFADVTLPDCVAHDAPCVDAAGGASAGSSGSGAHAGSGDLGGNAGALVGAGSSGLGGVAGSGEAGEAGVGGEAGIGTGGSAEMPDTVCRDCKLSPEALPDPCASNDSTMEVYIDNGEAPFSWQITAPSSGWSVSADSKFPGDTRHVLLVRAASASTSPVTLRVLDSTGKVLVSSYMPTLRQACWFAYTSLEGGKGQLSLRDPVLERTPPLSLPHANDVFDFRFSPNGRFLAYRYGGSAADPASGHLTMIDLVTKFEWSVFPDQAVKAYAWADDSHALAVAYESKGITYLGGARVTPASPGTSPTVTQLVPVKAAVESELFWSADRFVAFHSTVLSTGPVDLPNPERVRVPYFTQLGSNGFSTPVVNSSEFFQSKSPDPSVWLRPTPGGFFMTGAADSSSLFYPSGQTYSVEHGSNLISPRGTYSAGLLGSSLRIFRASDDASDLSAEPYAESSADFACTRLLAWATDAERIACVNDVPASNTGAAHGQLRVFDVGRRTWNEANVPGACTTASCAETQYQYSAARADGAPRLFSASGAWLAFTAHSSPRDYLYWANLSATAPFLRRHALADATDAGFAAFAFSPDEQYLLQQRGTTLSVHDLNAAPDSTLSAPKVLSEELKAAPVACEESFDEDPEHWCGASQKDLLFTWGPGLGSRSIAFHTSQGFTVASLLPSLGFSSTSFKAVDCSAECSNRFAFQPLP